MKLSGSGGIESPHGGLRPVHQKSTCLSQSTSGPYVVRCWSHCPPNLEGVKPSYSTVWSNEYARPPRSGQIERHARPFIGVFQKSINIRFINFWRYFPTKTNQWLQERTWDTPTKGLLWTAVIVGRFLGCRFVGLPVSQDPPGF